MTVAEYIKALQTLPQDLPVLVTATVVDKQTFFKPAAWPHGLRVAERHKDGRVLLESQLDGNQLQEGCHQYDAIRLA